MRHAQPTHTAPARALVVVIASLCVLSACSKEQRVVSEIRANYDEQDYEETMVLCEHALRRNIHSGEVFYYYGLALLAEGRDYEAFRRLHEATAVDSTLARQIAGELFDAGVVALGRGERAAAAARLKEAAVFDDTIELEEYGYTVAAAFFADHDFARAMSAYRSALYARPAAPAAEHAWFNLADCHLALADTASAIAALDASVENYPVGQFVQRARYKLVNLKLERARSNFALGNYEVTAAEINGLLEWIENRSDAQRARFLLGETYERMGDYQAAYEQYKAIIDEDRGASGRIVERARIKISTFRDSGLL